MIDAAKRMNLQRDREVEEGENLCEEHQEPLKLFCQDDKRLICMVCDRSKVHRDHSVVPVGEAVQEYKDIRTTLCRGQRETLSHSFHISLELEKKFSDFTEKSATINGLLEKFQDFLKFEFPLTTQVTLDPETANPRLYLSEDCKLVWWDRREQDLPSNPERFTFMPFVLGSRGFTSGWHCWDVEVHRKGIWAIGVAKESIPRDLGLCVKVDEGIWALRYNGSGYVALTSPDDTPLTLRSVPKRIRICLDYEEGRVVFFDAESKERIFAFPPASFQGERVFPWFMVMEDAQLKLLPEGTGQKNPKATNLPLGKKPRAF
ncbi:E3 ubiquitin-protein ligase TRIM7-like [Numenius arquata]|uniref:E3 ubiquitin-protein ligase TRIM7-like n=1 Tax=Numenius arquata TaxID=31919 RepID=UPI003D30C69E